MNLGEIKTQEKEIFKNPLIFCFGCGKIVKRDNMHALRDNRLEDIKMIEYIFGGLLLVMALFLVVAVLFQSGKDKRLSGSIAGGAETFFGKAKGSSMDKMLSKLTTIVSIVFMIVVIAMYIVVS